MVQLNTQEISEYRTQLASNKTAIMALDAIEDCEGDIEDAATSLAIEVGQKLDRVDWLDGIAKRCRVAICQEDFRDDLKNNEISKVVTHLSESNVCPSLLVTPIVIYVVKQGVESFCEPLSYKLT